MAKIELQAEQSEDLLRIIEVVKQNGKIKKGTNEVTKAAERSTAKAIIIATDVNPAEIVMHIPLICEEKNIPCFTAGTKEELGAAAGLSVGTTAIAITEEGNAKDDLKKFLDSVQ
ncbi:MAG: ribosomal L7Ae/L30e/S12e/Gadd45 family protein [Candidatus Woesearchaeota archaeon]